MPSEMGKLNPLDIYSSITARDLTKVIFRGLMYDTMSIQTRHARKVIFKDLG